MEVVKIVNARQAAEGKFLKPEHIDLKNNIAAVIDGGQYEKGKFGPQLKIGISYKKLLKEWTLNTQSASNLIDAFGENTEDWVEKKIELTVKENTSGKLSIVGKPHYPDFVGSDKVDKKTTKEEEMVKSQEEDKVPTEGLSEEDKKVIGSPVSTKT